MKIKEWLSLTVVATALTACTDSDATVAERESTLDTHGDIGCIWYSAS